METAVWVRWNWWGDQVEERVHERLEGLGGVSESGEGEGMKLTIEMLATSGRFVRER